MVHGQSFSFNVSYGVMVLNIVLQYACWVVMNTLPPPCNEQHMSPKASVDEESNVSGHKLMLDVCVGCAVFVKCMCTECKQYDHRAHNL